MNETQVVQPGVGGVNNRGRLLGLTGAVIGGFVWVVVAGFLIGNAMIWIAGMVVGAVVWWYIWRLSVRQPTRPALIFGVTAFLVCVLDLAFLAWILPQLPADSVGLWFGTDRAAFRAIRPLAMIGSASGAFVTAWQLWRYRSRGSKGLPPA